MTRIKILEQHLEKVWNENKYINCHNLSCIKCEKCWDQINEYLFSTDDNYYPITVCRNCFIKLNINFNN